MRILGLAGWSGSGKTTLLVGLIPALAARGVTVSTVKHAHHDVDIDRPGKDSHRHREAGAVEVVLSTARRWALVHELRGAPEPSMDEIVARLAPVDLVLVEGFKRDDHPKIEVHRPEIGLALLCEQDPSVVAVASDGPIEGLSIPVLDLNDPAEVAAFIIAHCGLSKD